MKPKHLYIFGTGGTARDVLETARLLRQKDASFPEIGGFLDDHVAEGTLIENVPVCGKIVHASRLPSACFVAAIGSPEDYHLKASMISRSGVADSSFISVIHPSVEMSPTASIGPGTVILSHCNIRNRVKLGKHVTMLQNCLISHDSQICDFSVIAPRVCFSGYVIAREGCYIGCQSSVNSFLEIGEGSLVGMGSVVLKNIPPQQVWCGNPARFLRANQNTTEQLV